MKLIRFPFALLLVAVTAPTYSQDARPRPQKKDDLPEVGFEIPEETRAEVKSLLKDNAMRLFSTKPEQRVKAAQVLGELGEEGRPVRALLCRAMLDANPTVRVSAADALKKIDPRMQYLAVALVTEESASKSRELLQRIKKLEDDGAPLVPLVAQLAARSAAARDNSAFTQQMGVLRAIAKNDLGVYSVIASALGNRNETVRRAALEALPGMKHGKLAVPTIIRLLNTEITENRIAAIEALTALADESTEEIVAAAIARQRYHKEERVRKAVEVALNKLENRGKP